MGKWNKINQKLWSQFGSSKSPPTTKQIWSRKDKSKCQVVLNDLIAKSTSKWYLDSGCFRHMIGDKSFFTSFENFDGGVVTFRDGNLAKVKGKGSIVILGCPKLDEVLYV